MGRLEGKIAIVTGAARGIGEGVVRVMAREGAIVVLTDILDQVHETAKSIRDQGHKAVSFKMDVTQSAESNDVVKNVLEQFGRVDILHNNAGVGKAGPLIDMTEAVWEGVFAVNVKGPFLCTKAVLPSMIKQRYGRIINTSSVTGPMVADPGTCAYSATKAALWGFTRALACEMAKYGITANAVLPGWIETPMMTKGAVRGSPQYPETHLERLASEIPMGRLGTPEEVGELVAFLASDEAKYMTGASIVLDGGANLPETYRGRGKGARKNTDAKNI